MSHFTHYSSLFLAVLLATVGVAQAQGGDVDGDRQLTVLDIQRTVNGILHAAPPARGDIDRDGAVDVRDVQRAANAILRQTPLLFDTPASAAPGDVIQLMGQSLDQVEVRIGDQPARVVAREGGALLAVQVPARLQGDQPLQIADGPAFPIRILCPDCESPFPHRIRWPQPGAAVAGPTPLVLETPDFGRDGARPVEAWVELDDQPVPVELTPLNGGPSTAATRYQMQLPDVYQLGTLVVVLADDQGRVDLLQMELEIFPAPSFLPEHEPLPGQVGVQLRLPLGIPGAQLVAVSLDDGARVEDFVQPDAPFGAWLGLAPGEYLFYAEAMGRQGLLSASAVGRVEHDSPAPIQLDLSQVEPLPMDPAMPRVVGVASLPLTRLPGRPVTLVAVTNQPMNAPRFTWLVNGQETVAGRHLPVLPENDLFVELQPIFDAPLFAATLPLSSVPGPLDRDASPVAPDGLATEYEGLPCGQVFAAMERTEFASERAAQAFVTWAESIVERPDCGAFLGWADPAQLEGFQPVAWLDGELPITELCVADSVCGGCQPFGEAQIEGNRAGSFQGICGVLSVAHSLVYKLGVVDEDDAMVDTDGDGTKDTWKQSFLNRIRRESGHTTENGTTVSGEQDAYEDFDDGEDFDIECGGEQEQDDYDWDNGTIDADELKAWCEGLDKQADDDDEDCTFIIRGETSGTHPDGSGNYAGHAMHVKSVAWDEANGRCTITTVNTGRQSANHNGDDVPVNPGEQTWRITRTGNSNLNVNIQRGSSSYNFFHSRFVWTKARSYCCKLD